MGGYREFRFYSAIRDAEAARLSVVDAEGREYFAIIDVFEGKRWRVRREAALLAIDDAIQAGMPPGEIDA